MAKNVFESTLQNSKSWHVEKICIQENQHGFVDIHSWFFFFFFLKKENFEEKFFLGVFFFFFMDSEK